MEETKTEDCEESNKNVLIKSSIFTVSVAIILYISFGVLLTIGGVLWVRSELKAFFDISYAEYGMLLCVIFLGSELWALFIQIPSIPGYGEIIASYFEPVRLFFGVTILFLGIILSLTFFFSPQDGTFRLYLAKMVYRLSNYSQNNYVEQLAMIDEMITYEESSAEQFAERGKIYLEIARIKTGKTEDYKYLLPDNTSEECYKIAINNFDDAIIQDDKVAEYYYLRGKAKYCVGGFYYDTAKDDFQKAIELDDTVPDYYFYCARAWYEISKNNSNNKEEIKNAKHSINLAIKKYSKEEEGDSAEKLEEKLENDLEADFNDILDIEFVNVKQNKILAEYYYYAGLIYNVSIDDYDKNLEKAIKNYISAAIYDRGNAEYFSQLGISYYGYGEYANAEKAFRSAVLIDKANSDYYSEGLHLAWEAHIIEQDEARVQEAIKIYEDSLKVRTDYAYSYRRLAELYEAENDMVSVENIYSRAIRECEDNAEFYYARGNLYYNENYFENAIEDMKKAIEVGSNDKASAYYIIGCSYHLLQNYSVAYNYYQLAKDNGNNETSIDEYMDTCLSYMEEE